MSHRKSLLVHIILLSSVRFVIDKYFIIYRVIEVLWFFGIADDQFAVSRSILVEYCPYRVCVCVCVQFQMFLTQINSSLVDSNMLVRCIVLSLDRFESQTGDVKGGTFKSRPTATPNQLTFCFISAILKSMH